MQTPSGPKPQDPSPKPSSVLIVGGGIAGLAAALRLADAGVRVTLLETRKKLGGRATSFTDARTGHVIDNCQHVALGCCTNYLDFCRRLGVADKLTWHRDLFWVEAGGRTSILRPSPLPAPGHLSLSFLAAKFLSLREKTAIALAMLAALRANLAAERERTFADWLRANSQPASAISKFWEPVIVSACNLSVERVSAASALHVFQEGFLAHRDAAAMSVSAVPLVELYDAAESVIVKSGGGGTLRLGCSVDEIHATHARTSTGEVIHADRVICAVPFERVNRLVSADIQRADPRFAPLDQLTHSPILGVHLEFDAPVLPTHSAVLVERPTQWLFRKDAEGKRLHAVISAADEWVPLDEAEITRRVLADIHACYPNSTSAKLLSSRPVKEKLATFAPTPKHEEHRPAADGPSGLILAGDYTQTGWPATMEGATRSGHLAAAAALGVEPRTMIKPPLAVAALARLLGSRA